MIHASAQERHLSVCLQIYTHKAMAHCLNYGMPSMANKMIDREQTEDGVILRRFQLQHQQTVRKNNKADKQ